MALTKVSGHIIDQPFDVGIITATNSYVSGIGTFGNIRVLGDIQVDGTTTTLDTVVTEVDRLEVGANNSTVGVAITQSGSGDIFNLYDGAAEVFTVTDGGKVGIEAPNPSGNLNISYLQVGKGQVSSDHSLYNYNTSFTNNAYQNGNGTFAHITSRAVGVINIQDNVLTFLNGPGGTAGQSATLTERLRITSAGLVGIGTNNPVRKLDVDGTSRFTDYIYGNSTTNKIYVNDDLALSATKKLYFDTGSNTYIHEASADTLAVVTGGTEKLRIDSSGKVGIGITNPDTKLTVKAGSGDQLRLDNAGERYTQISLRNNGTQKAALWLDETTDLFDIFAAPNYGMRLLTGGAERLRITSAGNLGINDTSPENSLSIKNIGSFEGDANSFYLGSNFTGTGQNFSGSGKHAQRFFFNNASSNGYLKYENTGTTGNAGAAITWQERFRITSDGKVRVPDNGKFTAGAGDDLQIYHDGSNSFMLNSTGELQISSGGSTLFVQAVTNENAVKVIPNAAVELYHDGSKKFETTATGVTVTGSLTQTTEYPTIRPVLDLNFAATKTLDRRITFTRDSIGTFLGEDGLVKYASNNVPRFDHDPTTGESLGLLIEETRTNLVEYGDFTTGWTEYGGTATSTTATTAPDGTFTAKKITSKGDQSTSGIYDAINYSANTTYTHTMWLKAGSVTIAGITVNSGGKWASSNFPYITVNLSTGAVTASGGVSAKATAYPNGWYRLEATGTFAGNTQVDAIWVHSQTGSSMSGNTTGYYYVWGPQAEQGAFATSYIPTSGSTVTRAQDTPLITGTNFTDFYNQSEGTLVLSADTAELATSNQAAVVFEDASNVSASFIGIGYNLGGGGSGHVGAWYNSSGTTSAFKTHNVGVTINTEFRQSFAYKLNDFVSVVNGGTPSTDTSGALTSLIDRVRFGIYHYDGMTSGHIRQFKYYNKRLPNAQLQGLTQQ